MSFDLTNKNISDTFQNLLQRTGSDNRLYDLEGNEICRQTVRSKTGLGGTSNDEIKWSPDMMACMQRKSHNVEKGI